jgi:ParB-like chromosome segregation protein Spo0J
MHIELSRIQVPVRKRPSDAVKVSSLASSMRVEGLLQPIGVTSSTPEPTDETVYTLVYGLHRLLAAKELKWNTISGLVMGTDTLSQSAQMRAIDAGASESEASMITPDLMAELAEIDENLIRYELSIPEFDAHNKRRKEIYEMLYPESTKAAKSREAGKSGGRDGKNGKPKSNIGTSVATPCYVADTVEKTGKSKSAICASLARAEVPNLDSVPEKTTLEERNEVASIHNRGVRAEKEAKRRAEAAAKAVKEETIAHMLSEAEKLKAIAEEEKAAAQEKIADIKAGKSRSKRPKAPKVIEKVSTPVDDLVSVDEARKTEAEDIIEGLLARIHKLMYSAPYASLKELEHKLLDICRTLVLES